MEHVYEDSLTPSTKSSPKLTNSYVGEVVIASPSIEATSTTSLDDETCQSELDHFPTAIQKLTFTSCMFGDSSMLTWPHETMDSELDGLNKSIESNIEFLHRDADTLIDSLQEALYVSQQRNGSLQQDVNLLKQDLYRTQQELNLLRKQDVIHPDTPRATEANPSIVYPEDEDERKNLQSLQDEEFDSAFSLPDVSPKCLIFPPHLNHKKIHFNNDYDDQQETRKRHNEEITQLRNEISIQNQYISTLSEKSISQEEELQLSHEHIRQLEYQIMQQEEKLHEKDAAITFQKQVIEKQQEYITTLKQKKNMSTRKRVYKDTDDIIH